MPRFETYDIPAHWASYFINSDPSGYEEEDLAAADAFVDMILSDNVMAHCVDVSDDTWFAWYHDARDVCPVGADVATFTFQVA